MRMFFAGLGFLQHFGGKGTKKIGRTYFFLKKKQKVGARGRCGM